MKKHVFSFLLAVAIVATASTVISTPIVNTVYCDTYSEELGWVSEGKNDTQSWYEYYVSCAQSGLNAGTNKEKIGIYCMSHPELAGLGNTEIMVKCREAGVIDGDQSQTEDNNNNNNTQTNPETNPELQPGQNPDGTDPLLNPGDDPTLIQNPDGTDPAVPVDPNAPAPPVAPVEDDDDEDEEDEEIDEALEKQGKSTLKLFDEAKQYILITDKEVYDDFLDGKKEIGNLKKGAVVTVKGKTSNKYYLIKYQKDDDTVVDGYVHYKERNTVIKKSKYDAAWRVEKRINVKCDEDGYVQYKNLIDGATHKEVVAATGHVTSADSKYIYKKPGIFFRGQKKICCDVCGDVVEIQPVKSYFETNPVVVIAVMLVVIAAVVAIVLLVMKKKKQGAKETEHVQKYEPW